MSMENMRQGAQGSGNKNRGLTRSTYSARWRPPAITPEMQRFLSAPPHEESLTQIGEPIVVIKGQYADNYAVDGASGQKIIPPPTIEAFRFRSHTCAVTIAPQGKPSFRTFRDIVCSCGHDPHAPQPCLPCYQVDHGADSKAKDQWAFNIAHLGFYHLKPWVKDGQIQVNRQTNQPIMIKDECLSYKMENIVLGRAANAQVKVPKGGNQGGVRTPRQCDGCQAQLGYAYGDHRVLQVGYKHLKNLFEIDDTLGRKCATCDTYLLTMYYDCANPQCNHRFLDVAKAGWTNQQLSEFAKEVRPCPACNYISTPAPYYQCGFDKDYRPSGGGCAEDAEPQKMSIYDCVLWIQREGASTESEIVVKRFEPISKYRTPDGRSLKEHLTEIVKEPFDLADMYGPDTTDEQAQVLGVANPYRAQQAAYQPYGSPQGVPGVQGGFNPVSSQPGMVPTMGGQQPNPYGTPMAYPGMPAPGRPNYGK